MADARARPGRFSPAEGAVQAKFEAARTTKRARLRDGGTWDTPKGPGIEAGSWVLADQDRTGTESRRIVRDVTWRPAINVRPDHAGDVAANRVGYIRDSSIALRAGILDTVIRARVRGLLARAEEHAEALKGHLAKDAHIAFLIEKGLRLGSWRTADQEPFLAGFTIKEAKFRRLARGAAFVAESVEHWRKWMHDDASEVDIGSLDLTESDLHERGLGVVEVRFWKPEGPEGHLFADETDVTVFIKPEDKSLEEKLLGAGPDSAASKINEIVGLEDPDRMLTTIRMRSTEEFGSLVERAKGMSAEDLTKTKGAKPIRPAFHEALVFAFLAGISDLHHENVFWHRGRPYLIDADNVLNYNQMRNRDSGAYTQTGFGRDYHRQQAEKNKRVIEGKENSVDSEILAAMLESEGKRIDIMKAIEGAITGSKGRIVPVRTAFWASVVSAYSTWDAGKKRKHLNGFSAHDFIVREGSFKATIGPGFYGTTYENVDDRYFDRVTERAELKEDFEAGVVPFYVYHFYTGHVTHNGEKVYHGQTLKQAMATMLARFATE